MLFEKDDDENDVYDDSKNYPLNKQISQLSSNAIEEQKAILEALTSSLSTHNEKLDMLNTLVSDSTITTARDRIAERV